jgi:hypothetical protein
VGIGFIQQCIDIIRSNAEVIARSMHMTTLRGWVAPLESFRLRGHEIMKDSVLRPNYSRPSLVLEGAEKPLAPLWIFKVASPPVMALLRSRLHRLLSGALMLIT